MICLGEMEFAMAMGAAMVWGAMCFGFGLWISTRGWARA
jgi:hypothetical protein